MSMHMDINLLCPLPMLMVMCQPFIAVFLSLMAFAVGMHLCSSQPYLLMHGRSSEAARHDFAGYSMLSSQFLTEGTADSVALMAGQTGACISTQMIRDASVLKSICHTYSDGCAGWFNSDGSVGYQAYNLSVNTYIKNATSMFMEGTKPGTRYFHIKDSDVFCSKYAG